MTYREKLCFLQGIIHGSIVVREQGHNLEAVLRHMSAALNVPIDEEGIIISEEICRELDRGGFRGENARKLAREQ